MDIYDAALKRLKADPRRPRDLKDDMGLPISTIREIQEGICKNPRWKTVRKIALYYFPKAA